MERAHACPGCLGASCGKRPQVPTCTDTCSPHVLVSLEEPRWANHTAPTAGLWWTTKRSHRRPEARPGLPSCSTGQGCPDPIQSPAGPGGSKRAGESAFPDGRAALASMPLLKWKGQQVLQFLGWGASSALFTLCLFLFVYPQTNEGLLCPCT